MPAAYSYLRFSSPQHATGDSIRRQTQARDTWLAAHPDVKLDASLVMTDAGRSGYNRKDWDTYALAQFVTHVKSGRVPKGSYLRCIEANGYASQMGETHDHGTHSFDADADDHDDRAQEDAAEHAGQDQAGRAQEVGSGIAEAQEG